MSTNLYQEIESTGDNPLPILTRKELSTMTCPCGNVGCETEMMLTGKCHPGAPAFVFYNPEGFVELLCCVCEKPTARVAISSGEEGMP